MLVPIEAIKGFLDSIFNGFTTLLDYLNPLSDNFFLKLFIENLFEFLNNIVEDLTSLVDYLNPFSENFILKILIEDLSALLKKLFVPSTDCFTDLYNNFNNKFGFIGTIKSVIDELFAYSDYGSDNYPTFTFTYAGVTQNIIDFSIFDNYRQLFHTIVVFVCWVPFLLRTYKKIPNLINGENGGIE